MNTKTKNLLTFLSITLGISTTTIATNDDYANISQSQDLDTSTIHYHFKNLTNSTMKVSKPTAKQMNAPFPISEFNIPSKGHGEFAADFAKYFSSIAFTEPTVLIETLAYTSGNKECQFMASIKASLKKNGTEVERVPHWSGNGKSIGAEDADCSTEILSVKESYPYSMSIEFSME